MTARPSTSRPVRAWMPAAAVLAVLLVVGCAPVIGIERLPGIAAVLPARSAWTVAAAALGLVLGAVGVRRRIALPTAVALLAGAAVSGVIVLQHGVTNGPPAGSSGDGLRILSWNTNGELVPPAAVAALAGRERADVVVLPEISPEGTAWTDAFAPLGMRGLPTTDDGVVTAVFTRGGYALAVARSPEPDRSLVLAPQRPGLPRIVAIHAIMPAPGSTAAWAADLRWIAGQCADPDTIAIGDVNTSVDGFGGGTLGGCTDAASAVGAASVGSWPTALPTWLAMPIDHVLTGTGWRTRSFTVLTTEDASGARHRPILAVVARR